MRSAYHYELTTRYLCTTPTPIQCTNQVCEAQWEHWKVINYPQSTANEMQCIDFDFSWILRCLVNGAAPAAIALRHGGSRGQFAFLQQRDNASNGTASRPAVQIAADTSWGRWSYDEKFVSTFHSKTTSSLVYRWGWRHHAGSSAYGFHCFPQLCQTNAALV
jgi:hypothetical protein